MAISVNWATKIISVPQADLAWIGGTNYQLDTNAFRIALRNLEDSEDGMTFLPILNHNTVVTLGGIQYARIIEIINGYSVTFEAGLYAVTLLGSNNNILDVTNLNSVATRSNNSAGLMSMQEIEHGAFNGGVTIDVVNGSAGTLYPIGTTRKPVNNFADARQIAIFRGFNVLYINSDATLDSTANIASFILIGKSSVFTALDIQAGATASRCVIKNCRVVGTLDGGNQLVDCDVDGLSFFNGEISDSGIEGTITLGGGATAIFSNCRQHNPLTYPTINMGGSGQSMIMTDWDGEVHITNCADAATYSHYTGRGEVLIEPSVTLGTFEVFGDIKLGNNTTSGTVLVKDRTSSFLTADKVWNYAVETFTAQEMMRIMLAALAGKRQGLGTATETYYGRNGTTPRITLTPDANGNGLPVVDGTP